MKTINQNENPKTPMKSTKSDTQSITVTVSGDLARQLEEFAKVALATPEELASGILSAKFGQDRSLDILQECIVARSAEYSKAQAKQVAENYDAYVVKDAQRNGHPVMREARVQAGQIWFPAKAAA
jgi:hypothetical protein